VTKRGDAGRQSPALLRLHRETCKGEERPGSTQADISVGRDGRREEEVRSGQARRQERLGDGKEG
jgi:hypothetical protein